MIGALNPQRSAGLAVAALVLFAGFAAQADAYHVILCGSGGELEYQRQFPEWSNRLKDALVTRLGVPADHVTLLTASETAEPQGAKETTLDDIQALFDGLRSRIVAGDDLVVYLIGHGSYLKDTSSFHIPGPDLTATKLDGMLAELPARYTLVVNATSSSAGFINVLSGPNRIICTATKSVSEFNATEFMRFFIEGLEDGSADRNHDERISFLEACEQAAELTASWYSSRNLLATEHAILDDNGDGLGSRLPIAAYFEESDDPDTALVFDGSLADSIYLKDYVFPEDAPRELIDTYLAALDDVEALKKEKDSMPESEYYAALEKLLIKAARANREIRSYADISPHDS